MPTILVVRGWRVFFYSDEGCEPVHVHAEKGGAECKVWLLVDEYNVDMAWERGMKPALRRELRKIIFDHFDYIVDEWHKHFRGQTDGAN
jgi:hypothetical protein